MLPQEASHVPHDSLAGGLPLIDENIKGVIEHEFEHAHLQYGEHYVNLGYKAGLEVAIKVTAQNLRQLSRTDTRGNSLDSWPMTKDVQDLKNFKLLISISAGMPGAKEWVQYAGTPLIPVAAGVTGVQAPQLFPYFPDQMVGLLAAVKGAAEYEAARSVSSIPSLHQRPGIPLFAAWGHSFGCIC